MLRNADGGGGCPIFPKKRYEGVMFMLLALGAIQVLRNAYVVGGHIFREKALRRCKVQRY